MGSKSLWGSERGACTLKGSCEVTEGPGLGLVLFLKECKVLGTFSEIGRLTWTKEGAVNIPCVWKKSAVRIHRREGQVLVCCQSNLTENVGF